jgi:hypothetical protein
MKYIVYLFLHSNKVDFYICKSFRKMHVGFRGFGYSFQGGVWLGFRVLFSKV